ncbi:hypothetical protein HY450_01525 [Candidatus Pacearchaeota archaeon]|nr:hypothetical protein [Candidatus Pacearchaeota archaeon]
MANRERGAALPTGEQSAFMLDEAYNSKDPTVKDSSRTEFVRNDIMRNGGLWVPEVTITTPQNTKNPGMYSVFDENGEGLRRVYTTEELEDRLTGGDTEKGVRFSQDRTVAFAPQNIVRAGEHKKGTLAQDGACIAVYSPEGAEALDRMAEQFRFKLYSRVAKNNSNENIQSLSALLRGRDLVDDRLDAYFYSDGSWGGYVLSVSGSNSIAEGDAPKICIRHPNR